MTERDLIANLNAPSRLDLRPYQGDADATLPLISSISLETRFILTYKCGHSKCDKDHTYILTAKAHVEDTERPGLWCADAAELVNGDVLYNDNAKNLCLYIPYNGEAPQWMNQMAVALRMMETGQSSETIIGEFFTGKKITHVGSSKA